MNFFPRQSPSSSRPAPSFYPTSFAAVSVQSGSQRRASDDSVSASSASATPSGNASDIQSASSSRPSSSSAPSNPPSSSSAPSSSRPASSSSSSIVPSSSSEPPSSSSSAPPSSSSVLPSSSSSSTPPSSTPESATPASASASDSGSDSASTTVIVTSTLPNGEITTFVSGVPPPTSLSTAGPTASSRRTAIIAGATAAGVGVILLLLGALFVYKRHKSRRLDFFEAIGRVRREATGAGGAGLLDDEGFDDDDSVPMRRYRDNAATPSIHPHSRSTSTIGPPQSPTPSLFRQRAETGSVFREEGVWPPPQGTQFVDPLVGVGTSEGLSHIVDDVMGPAAAHHPNKDIPSMSSASTSLYNDPFRDMSHSHGRQPSDPSLYFDRRDASTSSTGSAASGTGSRPTTPQSLLGLPAGAAPAPKKSSPLANPTPPSPTMSTWLSRSPKKPGSSPLLHEA